MIVFTATLSLIIAAVVALAGVADSSGSTHSPGDHFVLSGHSLSSLSAGRLFLSSIVCLIVFMLFNAGGWRRDFKHDKAEPAAASTAGPA